MVFIEGCQCLHLLVELNGNMLLVNELMVFLPSSINEFSCNLVVTELMVVFLSSIFSCGSWKYVS